MDVAGSVTGAGFGSGVADGRRAGPVREQAAWLVVVYVSTNRSSSSRESVVRLVGGAGWAVKPFLMGLPEVLHLAAGGGVVRLGILMNHAEDQGGRARVHARYSEFGPQRYDGSAVVL